MLVPININLDDQSILNIVIADLIKSYDTNLSNHSTHPEDKIHDKKIQKALRRVISYYTTSSERKDLGLDY
jgi:hypothetical protein